MGDGGTADAKVRPAHDGIATLVAGFLRAANPVALLQERGARLDETFAANGSHEFVLAGVAGPGSQLVTGPDGDDLTLVLAAGPRLTLADAENLWGKARSVPAVAGHGHRFAITGIPAVPGRTARILVELTAEPSSPASQVHRLTVLREPG